MEPVRTGIVRPMRRVQSTTGVTVSYDQYGRGPSLVLVHGGFSDHQTNWEFVKPPLERQFCVFAIARRGRGETEHTDGHSLEDEADDVAAVIESIGEPVFLLGHSYGAQVSLVVASKFPNLIRKLVVYEAPQPTLLSTEMFEALEELAQAGDWDGFSLRFFHEVLRVPTEELTEVRRSDLWPPILADARASLNDLRALARHPFDPERLRGIRVPVLLQIGSESPRELYVTDALAAVLPNARIEALPGQAHEGMTTAPEMYAAAVGRFLHS